MIQGLSYHDYYTYEIRYPKRSQTDTGNVQRIKELEGLFASFSVSRWIAWKALS